MTTNGRLLKAFGCPGASELESLRAVIDFHRMEREAARMTKRTGGLPRIRTPQLDDLQKRFAKPPAGRSIRSRLVDTAVELGANVYSAENGTVDELKYFLDRGLPVIVGMWPSKGGDFDDNATGSQRVTSNLTQYAVVRGVDDTKVSVICPSDHGQGQAASATDIPRQEFEKRWYSVDDDDKTKPGQGKIERWYGVLNFENREFALAFAKPTGRDKTPPDARRRGGILTAFAGIVVAELFLAWFSYTDPDDYTAPLIAITLGVGGFTAIDFYARPEKRRYSSNLTPRWYRPYLSFWCLVPFLTAISGSVWVHFEKWHEARADIHQLAREIKAAVEWPDDDSDSSKGNVKDSDRTEKVNGNDKASTAADTASHTTQGSDKKADGVAVPVAASKSDSPAPQSVPLRVDQAGPSIDDPSEPPVIGCPLNKDNDQAMLDELSDDPVDVFTKQRGRFATDEATNLCWRTAQGINQREARMLLSHVPTIDGKPNPFFTMQACVPRSIRKAVLGRLGRERYWKCFTTERVTAKVGKLVATRYQAEEDKAEARRFVEIARVIGHDLLTAHGDVGVVCDNVGVDTGSGFLLAIGVQGLFIFWVPALLAIAISRAQKRTKRDSRQDVQRSMNLRDHTIMAEDQYQFLPRMCFAILLVLGTNYVFAPLGLKATYIMSIVDEHALPGHTTFALWSTSFSQAPVLVVGFVGFLVYALITATQRFVQDDFDDRSLLALLVRGLVVILLSFALSSSDVNEFASRLFVFFAGVFPVRALEAIAKKANTSIDPDFSPDQPPSFAGLPGLDPVKVFALRAAGIQSTYDLAAMNINDVAERVRIDPRLLGRAVDRAILIDALGLKLTERLGDFGITSATELVEAKGDALANLILPKAAPSKPEEATELTSLLAATQLVRDRLAKDQRVVSVAGWVAEKLA